MAHVCHWCGTEFSASWLMRRHIIDIHPEIEKKQPQARVESAPLSVDEMARLNGMKRTNKEWLEHSHYAN